MSIPKEIMKNMDPEAMRRNAARASQMLRGIANENRLMVLCCLAQGERSVSELNDSIHLSQSALSQHLALMRKEGLVETRRESQTMYYRLAESPVLQIMAVLYEIYCGDGDDTDKKLNSGPAN